MTTQTFNKLDIDTHKGVSAVGYFLFFIPLFVKNSPFGRSPSIMEPSNPLL